MKMACLFGVAPASLFFLLLLLLEVTDLESDDTIKKDGEIKKILPFLPWDDNGEEDE